ncbi:MAG: sarcosine oxidase subunit alpha family protein [Hoeflea sp.]|nr:sarcosine oxidase subunit alpha family protein [Alphaproteobacteria bacterium]MBV1723701.1 sarcosine oxidase subunit alpha family protein [Hoeflea sp.]MBU4543115.1 sarcosine oxidase subunit alpha family protein [Alphaproteobacteria bacterium]MBU4551806.1 sarcosine oxidase subunit alpha family protein [Alphaproteobacteria bacterium]MBV1762017.1 sarcosine oxidase subunit alpha family protein [Hoeflea sp.]
MSFSRFDDGGLIDRSRTIRFSFDGRSLEGFAGDTLASALLANGVSLMGRSFKYHRPRGLLSGGASEPNALVTIGDGAFREPNLRASMVVLRDGLVAESQNRWPSLGFDVGAVNQALSPFLGAGFYYKTFMWPAGLWETLYEPLIRKAAGLGRASHAADPQDYEKRWAHCDVLVIGSGPAGLMAALTAARAGARVVLCDENAGFGGRLIKDKVEIGEGDGPGFAASVIAELAANPNVRLLSSTTVFGSYDSGMFGAVERRDGAVSGPAQRVWRIAAKRAVLAAGAEERPLVFGGNDRPGTMMASAMRGLANAEAIRPGDHVAVFTTGPSGHETARDLLERGLEVTLVDARSEIPAAELAASEGARVLLGHVVADTTGGKAVAGVEAVNRATGERLRIKVDALAMAGGWNPVVGLACHRGDKPVWDAGSGMFLPPAPRDGLVAAGSAAGILDLAGCLKSGAEAGAQAAGDLGFKPRKVDAAAVREACGGSSGFQTLWHVAEARGKAFLDFQNDVTVKDLGLAVREGYGHVELAKRYTTTGMATDQGKLSNVNAIGILAENRGVTPDQVGTTTFRPFYTPVSIGALAGEHRGAHYRPVRRSPLHHWAEKHGAVFIEAGAWLRASHFPRDGEPGWKEACDRETLAVRASVGISDASTLGKIDLSGKDAGQFLDLVYTSKMSTLAVGKARYGLMLREDGMVMDDGTVSRLGESHYLITTTTAAAGEAMAHMEFCAQALWPELHVRLASVTDQWAQITVAGPASRDVLSRVVDADLSDEAMPFTAAREVRLHSGLAARLFRISFSGELAFELAVPARRGEAVADAILEAGEPFGIVPYGLEALNVLRIEKGFITHAEIDGRTTPGDLGLGKMVSTKKDDFIGKAMLAREGLQRDDREQLVGLRPVNPAHRILAGGHLLEPDAAPTMANDQGHVTSACWSPHLNSTIALAMLKGGRGRHGEVLIVWDPLRGVETRAIVGDPVLLSASDGGKAPATRAHPPVVAEEPRALDLLKGLTISAPDRADLALLPEAPVCLILGPAGMDAAVRKAAKAGDGVLRAVQPGQALAVGAAGESVAALTQRLGGPGGGSLCDLTDARVRFFLSGPEAGDIIATQSGIDLQGAMLAPGASAPTLFGHVPVQLTRLGPDAFEIMAFSTYARDLAQSLARSIRLLG